MKTETATLPNPNFLTMESSPPSLVNYSPTGGEENRNWKELPRDVMVTILMKLAPREILENVQVVCKSWHEACEDPAAWTKIEIHFSCEPEFRDAYEEIAYAAVNRSCGRLLEISLDSVCDDFLLLKIAERSSNLRCLHVRFCYGQIGECFEEAIKKFPNLEEVEFTLTSLDCDGIRVIGLNCPKLVTFKLNQTASAGLYFIEESNDEAVAIAEAMPHIRHLQLIGSMMTNKGLQAILDGCTCLESLDLRACFQIDLSGDLRNRLAEKVRVVKWPHDSTSDCYFQATDDFDYGDVEEGLGVDLSDDDDDYDDYGYFNELEDDVYMGNYDDFCVEDFLDFDDLFF